MNEETVKVGDKIKFSVELLREIDSLPDHSSHTVKVAKIQRYEDSGETLVYLELSTTAE